MSSFFARAVFRLRAWIDDWLQAPRRVAWRLLGMQLGRGSRLKRVHVTWPHQVCLGQRCVVEHDVYFKFDGIYVPGPRIVFGDDVFIGCGTEFNIRVAIRVGDHALIASGCRFIDHDHGYSRRSQPMGLQADGAEAAIHIEDDVWIGANAVVLKGVTIGRGAIVAAGSVVTRSVGPYEIWGGVPARKLRNRPDEVSPTMPMHEAVPA